jgi:hypothetical protein
MIRLFLEQVALLEMRLLITLIVIILGASLGFAVWLGARKSRRQYLKRSDL